MDIKSRIDWVDVAKGIGIVLVVYGHVLVGLTASSMNMHGDYFSLSHGLIWSFHMHLFFFLAGLFASKSLLKRGRLQFILNKLAFIVYPYLLWSIIQGTLQSIVARFTNSSISYEDVLFILYRPLPNQHFWFLYVLFMMYFVIFIFYRNKNIFYFLFITSFIFLYFPINTDIRVIKKFQTFMFFFFFGMMYYKIKFDYIVVLIKNYINLPFLFIIFFSYIVIYLYIHEKCFYYFIKPFFSIYGILIVVISSIYITKFYNHHILQLIGSHSLSIYLAHSIFLAGMRIFLYNVCGIQNVFVHIFAGTVMGTFVPLLLSIMAYRYHFRYIFVFSKY